MKLLDNVIKINSYLWIPFMLGIFVLKLLEQENEYLVAALLMTVSITIQYHPRFFGGSEDFIGLPKEYSSLDAYYYYKKRTRNWLRNYRIGVILYSWTMIIVLFFLPPCNFPFHVSLLFSLIILA